MSNRNAKILGAGCLAISGALSIAVDAGPVLRGMLGLPLIFYLPGWAILQAAFRQPETGLEGRVFAAGLSIATTVFCGFVLHVGGRMTPQSWSMMLCAITVLACCLVFLKNWRSPGEQIVCKQFPVPTRRGAAMLVFAVVTAAGAVVLARQMALAHHEFAFTELWIVPTAADTGGFTVGLKNGEKVSGSYDLEMTLDNSVVLEWRALPLRVGESWTSDVSLPIAPDAPHTIAAHLFKAGDHQRVYRRVWLRISHGA